MNLSDGAAVPCFAVARAVHGRPQSGWTMSHKPSPTQVEALCREYRNLQSRLTAFAKAVASPTDLDDVTDAALTAVTKAAEVARAVEALAEAVRTTRRAP